MPCLNPWVPGAETKEGIVTVVTTWRPAPTSGPVPHRRVGRPLERSIVAGALIMCAETCATILGERSFNRLVTSEVDVMLARASRSQAATVNEAMLEKLPAPVQRYLNYTGVVGKPIVRTVQVAQSGRMRLGPRLPWLPLRAKEYYSVQPPGFVWDGTLQVGHFPVAHARDMYFSGKGKLLVKAASALTVVDCGGDGVDQASMMRYLSEMIWFPSAFLSGSVSFEAVDEGSARVTLTDHGHTATGILSVDPDGRLTNFVAQRYRMVGGRLELGTWSTPVHEYGVRAGLRLPVRGRGIWQLEDGEFEYIDVWLDDVRYDTVLGTRLHRE